MRLAVALISVAVVGATAYLGRRDLTRPPVVFGVVWFGFAALAQLQLTTGEADWSLGFAALVIAGGLLLMGAALVASGTRPARGLTIDRGRYRSNRLVAIAILLLAGAAAGWAYKRDVLGGIPLLSGSADTVRARASTASGEVTIPAWSSALTGGAYLAFWCLLAAAWLEWRSATWWRRSMFGLLAAVALFVVAFDASRNPVLLAVSVPLLAAYLIAPPARRLGTLLRAGVAIAVVALVVGGIFLARLGQTGEGSGGRGFLSRQEQRNPAIVHPFLPVYVNGVLPFDAYQRVYEALPTRSGWGNGGYSLLSLPDAVFRHGKPDYGGLVTTQLHFAGVGGFWSVATYQGRAYADEGAVGVLAESILLGLLLGATYRLGRSRRNLFGAAVIGYAAYYSAFMTYDNLLSFTLIAIYDLGVLFAADWFARLEVQELESPTQAGASSA
jgi:hypothetical protein